MANRPELVLMCLALNKLGAIWVPICTDYRGEWLRDALSRSRPAALVVDAEHLERLRVVRADATDFLAVAEPLARQRADVCGNFASSSNGPAYIYGYAGPSCWNR